MYEDTHTDSSIVAPMCLAGPCDHTVTCSSCSPHVPMPITLSNWSYNTRHAALVNMQYNSHKKRTVCVCLCVCVCVLTGAC